MTTPPTVQIPSVLGDPLACTVNATPSLKLHSAPSVTLPTLHTLPTGMRVTEYPANTVLERPNTFVFIHDAAGNPGWVALQYLTPTAAPTVWTVNLNVPYVSQLSAQAVASNNDCGIASLLMIERYWFNQHGLSTPTIPSVDDLERRSPLAQPNPPHGLTFADIQLLATLTGFQTRVVAGLTPDSIIQYLHKGQPVIALLDYGTFNPGAHEEFAHFAVVKGFNDGAFLCADPYKGGNNYRISRVQLDAAMKTVIGNSGSYQGIVLVP